jgi:CRP/FNR family transcriptional regulator, nitrogen oxide reductase regulator
MAASPIIGIRTEFRSRFLEGLAPPDLRVILAAATQRHLSANSVVTNHGDSASHFFLLTKGRARFFYITQEGQKILLHWLVPGEVFGAMALLPNPSSYLVSTEIVKDSLLSVWDRATIQNLVARYPRLAVNALSTASDYLILYLAAHVALICDTARQRLARVIVNLARGIGQAVPGGVELDVTNEELANAANVTPFTASRLLSEWQRNGAVVKSRGKVMLRAPERLFLHEV